ncbi:MAG TPA: Calx-beta domain-containing protein [Burkholderiaceae bacterium]|nr:Calx-beta domain-containing protein [Burkholderiaceae bacterium]
MATSTVSVSFADGFVGDYFKNNEAINSQYMSALGWSKLQFAQTTDNGQFGGTQGNDYSGQIIVTDALGVVHTIDGVINWRAPSGSVSTMVFYATGSGQTLATTGGGSYTIDPFTETNGDPHTFLGLTFNGATLAISGGDVNGNAATSGLLSTLNTYLAAQPQLSVSDASVNESDGGVDVTVTLSKASADTVTVNYATSDGTATTAGHDYTAVSGSLSFAPGQTSKVIHIAIGADATPEAAETFNVTLSASSYAAITDGVGVVTINADSAPAAVTVSTVLAEDAAHTGASPVDSSVVEGASLLYTVALSGTTSGATEYALAIGGTASSSDYGSFTFSDGVAWKNGDAHTGIIVVPGGVSGFTVTVATVDDAQVENAESLTLTVGGVAATGTITDNDSQSVTSVTAEDAAHVGASPVDSSVVEGASLLYTVALNSASPSSTEHTLAIGGTATSSDYGSFTFSDGVAWKNGDANTGIIVVPANVSGFTITVATVDDTAVSSARSLTLTVGGVAATGTITDNDSVSVSSVVAEDAAHTGASPVDSSVVEGASLLYTVALSGAASGATEYALAIGGTASSSDYGSFTFSDGVAWKNGDATTGIIVVPDSVSGFTVTVATVDDTAVSSARSLTLTVGGVAATGTITDNDSVSVSSVVAEDAAHTGASPLDSSVVEGASLLYTVALSGATSGATEYALATSGTASSSDYGSFTFSDGVAWKNGDASTGIIVVPSGVSGFTVAVATTDDALVESAESLVLTVGGVAATGTITDNDSQSVTSVTAEDAAHIGASPIDSSVVEGASLRYTVALNGASPSSTEHTLAISGTASAADYTGITFSDGVAWKNGDPNTGIIVVPSGVSGFAITVATRDDTLVEHTESLTLTVGGVAATGSIVDNDVAPLAPTVQQEMSVKLGPVTDGGTGPLAPSELTIYGGGQLVEGGAVRLVTSTGEVVETSTVTAEQAHAGQVHLPGMVLDDGVYTFTAQILDSAGKVKAQAPVTMTVVTDVDGVLPSVELAANGGDFNHDGIADWQQNNVGQLPLASVEAFQLGKLAPASSFGAIMAGQVDPAHPDAPVQLAAGAQLLNLSVSAPAAPLPDHVTAATPLLHFSVTQQSGGQPLADLAPDVPGLQVRVVIDLPPGGVQANDFLKWDSKTGTWYSFLDDQNLATADNGATLLDLNGDGKVDRMVVTLTDGGPGDEDGLVNGTIVDPGMLVQRTVPAPDPAPVVPPAPAATPVLSVLLANGDRYYTTDAAEAARMAQGTGNVFEGARFDSVADNAGGHHLQAAFQPYTQDWYFAAPGQAMPYSCYNVVAGAAGFGAAAAGAVGKVDVHLYQNVQGLTQLLSGADAGALGLAAKGYVDRGAMFSTTQDSAFVFDPEGYLLANQGNAGVQALVRQLAASYGSVSDARFVDAVEQNYLSQVQLVGVQHGGAAGAAELNAAFGTHFGN